MRRLLCSGGVGVTHAKHKSRLRRLIGRRLKKYRNLSVRLRRGYARKTPKVFSVSFGLFSSRHPALWLKQKNGVASWLSGNTQKPRALVQRQVAGSMNSVKHENQNPNYAFKTASLRSARTRLRFAPARPLTQR